MIPGPGGALRQGGVSYIKQRLLTPTSVTRQVMGISKVGHPGEAGSGSIETCPSRLRAPLL